MASLQSKTDQNGLALDYQRILDASPLMTVVCSGDLSIYYANAAFKNAFWQYPTEISGHKIGSIVQSVFGTESNETISFEPSSIEKNLTKSNGSKFWGQISRNPAILEDGSRHWIIQISDITAQKAAEFQASYLGSIWKNAIKASKQGVWDYYAPTQRHYYSDEWREMRGIPLDEDLTNGHEDWLSRLHPEDHNRVIETIEELETGNQVTFTYEYRERNRSGKYFWVSVRGWIKERDAQGRIAHVVGTDVDITALKEREKKQSELVAAEHQRYVEELHTAQVATETGQKIAEDAAARDPLTNLPNRRAFSDRLALLGQHARSEGMHFALIIVDLDRFKPVNDTHGHAVGDSIICMVADRLQRAMKPPNLAARLGGDEFGILLTAPKHRHIKEYATEVANHLIFQIDQPFSSGSLRIEIGASVGIACETEFGKNTDTLLRKADMALYCAKQNQRGSCKVFDAEMSLANTQRSVFETDVRTAVRETAFVPHFQPIVDMVNDQVAGFELLSRWQHPELGSVEPSRFIPVIEHLGLSKIFGQAMLREASGIFRDWPDHLRLTFNITANGVSDPAFTDRFLREIADNGLSPARLEIEVTDSALLRDFTPITGAISKLRNAGIRVSLGDFGVGYSGLSNLRVLEVDSLKLDRSFTLAMQQSTADRKIVETVLTISEKFGMDIVAEGIENEETKKMLCDMGYRYGQGFLFAPALHASEVPDFLKKWSHAGTSSAQN